MKNFFKKIFTKNVIIALIIGLSLFGILKYIEYRLNYISQQIETNNFKNGNGINDISKRVANLEKLVEGTQSNITDVLQQEQEKNNSLLNQVNEITNTVGALSKLSKTDPELLKKYSKVYFLNEHYVPISLSAIGPVYTTNKSINNQIHSNVLPYLEKMISAGNTDGVSILSQSAYRSFQTQAILKSNYRVIYGAGTANSFSADQGYSEHQLGTTIDFTTLNKGGTLEGFDKTPEYKWLGENAYKYGFIISYPSGNKYYKYAGKVIAEDSA
ncbi:MAG: M15 family metallopeptidase [Candidatus Staskawiczbacteria bacterium]